MNVASAAVLGFFIALGLGGIGAAGFLAAQEARMGGRYVTVKGLAEKEVKADLALWNIKIRAANNDMAAAQQQMDTHVAAVTAFLEKNGLAKEAVELKGLRVVDLLAQEYGSRPMGETPRYLIDATVLVKSANVDAVAAASARTGELFKEGINLMGDGGGCAPGPEYRFMGLNDIKPEMLKAATENARASAQKFAENSGSGVGALKTASQGYFSITARDAATEGGEGGGCLPSDPNKMVRVVTTMEYYLK